jgi:hypothetical protein
VRVGDTRLTHEALQSWARTSKNATGGAPVAFKSVRMAGCVYIPPVADFRIPSVTMPTLVTPAP